MSPREACRHCRHVLLDHQILHYKPLDHPQKTCEAAWPVTTTFPTENLLFQNKANAAPMYLLVMYLVCQHNDQLSVPDRGVQGTCRHKDRHRQVRRQPGRGRHAKQGQQKHEAPRVGAESNQQVNKDVVQVNRVPVMSRCVFKKRQCVGRHGASDGIGRNIPLAARSILTEKNPRGYATGWRRGIRLAGIRLSCRFDRSVPILTIDYF